MAGYDPYDREPPRRYVREERRDERDVRYADPRDHGRTLPSRDLIPRVRQDSDVSVEEIRREFPLPSGRDVHRARSADHERYYDEVYDYRRDPRYDQPRARAHPRDYDHGGRHAGSDYEYEDRRSKHKSMSKQDKVIAAVAGAALLAGGKEIFDRYEAKQEGLEVNRNPLSSVALAGFGALAGYQGAEYYSKQQAKRDQKAQLILHRGRDGYVSGYYSDEGDGDGDARSKKGHKNFLESALAATGLGAAVKTLTSGGKDDDRYADSRSRGGSPTRSRAGSTHTRAAGGTNANKIQQAAMASLLAGATEAFRVSKEPGGWKGEKTKRILTAAAGAATVDAAMGEKQGKLGIAEAVIGGLVGNRLINGSKRDIEEDKVTGRSRSRSRSRAQSRGGGSGGGASGLAALATAGLGALGAKAALDHHSRSRSRGGSRDRSYDSRDGESYDKRRRSRSRSVVDKARNSLAKLGIGSGAGPADDYPRRRDHDDFDDTASSRRSRRYSDEYEYDAPRYEPDSRSHGGGGGGRGRGGGGGGGGGGDYEYERPTRTSNRRRGASRSGYASESSLGDSEEDEKKAKKMRGKQLISTGLATVATIHAAHNVYQSMERRTARQKAVQEGRLSASHAKDLKTNSLIKDAASVGLAALGIKGALKEMKEAKEMTHECKVFQEEKMRRHERREQLRRLRQLRGRSSSQDAVGNGRGIPRAESWDPSASPSSSPSWSRFEEFEGFDGGSRRSWDEDVQSPRSGKVSGGPLNGLVHREGLSSR